MTTTTHRTRAAAIAQRLGCTEGQIYTLTIGLSLSLLLLVLGLQTNFTPVPRAEAQVLAPQLGQPVDEPPPLNVTGGASLLDLAPLGPQPSFATLDPPAAAPSTPPPAGSTDPEPNPCANDNLQQTAKPIVAALEGTGVVPSDSVLALLGVASGCNTTDPVVVALGLIAEFGSRVPDPGFRLPVIPLPFVEIPSAVVDLVQPLRPAIDPICDAAGAVVTVVLFGFATYPLGIDSTMLTAVNQVLLVCGQVRV